MRFSNKQTRKPTPPATKSANREKEDSGNSSQDQEAQDWTESDRKVIEISSRMGLSEVDEA